MRTVLTLLTLALGLQSSFALDWPQWRGPERTGISAEKQLLKSWPTSGPKRVWINSKMGLGYSSFAVVKGKLYTMGSRRNTEQLICLFFSKYSWLVLVIIASIICFFEFNNLAKKIWKKIKLYIYFAC